MPSGIRAESLISRRTMNTAPTQSSPQAIAAGISARDRAGIASTLSRNLRLRMGPLSHLHRFHRRLEGDS